jgi:hypothetical protein
MAPMLWPGGEVELEPEVTEWIDTLTDEDFGQVERYIDLLADQGVLLGEPFTRQLDGKPRELRFYLGRRQTGSATTSPPTAGSRCSRCSP